MSATIASHALLPLTESETVIPDPGRLIFALRQIGYSLEQALSDLIDNSISAGAHNVLIRFIWTENRIVSVAVVDDGHGMSEQDLRNAMRFGSRERMEQMSLGKFGLGLKLASFSHARQLTVVSAHEGRTGGRRWTLQGIRRNWDCAKLDAEQSMTVVNSPWSPIDLTTNGTIILWEEIDKLSVSSRGLRFTLRALHRRLELHLGLHFHRYLQTNRLRILIDQQELGQTEHRIRAEISPLDPFAYEDAPNPAYPTTFSIRLPEIGNLDAEAHIWPPNSDRPEYKLGNRAATRQGFYFYRNDRLIQAGGWNSLVQNESEPHSSLARIRIDLPSGFDSSFSLNVQKSSVIVPPGFVEAAQEAMASDGTSFDVYRLEAQSMYRNKDRRALSTRPLVPGSGLPPRLASEFHPMPPGDAQKSESPDWQRIDITWTHLGEDEFFRIDTENGKLLLNSTYRNDVLVGLSPSAEDVPMLKTLLLCLIGNDLRAIKLSEKRRRELARINRLLVTAARLGMG